MCACQCATVDVSEASEYGVSENRRPICMYNMALQSQQEVKTGEVAQCSSVWCAAQVWGPEFRSPVPE